MTSHEGFLNQRQRYQSIKLPQNFSDEEMALNWTLSDADKKEISKYRKNSRLFITNQLSSFVLVVIAISRISLEYWLYNQL